MARLDLKNEQGANDINSNGDPFQDSSYIMVKSLRSKAKIEIRENELTKEEVQHLPKPYEIGSYEQNCITDHGNGDSDMCSKFVRILEKNEKVTQKVKKQLLTNQLKTNFSVPDENQEITSNAVKDEDFLKESHSVVKSHLSYDFHENQEKNDFYFDYNLSAENEIKVAQDSETGPKTAKRNIGVSFQKRKQDSDVELIYENEDEVDQDCDTGPQRKKRRTDLRWFSFSLKLFVDDLITETGYFSSFMFEEIFEQKWQGSSHVKREKSGRRLGKRQWRDEIMEEKRWVRFMGALSTQIQQSLRKRSLNLLGNGRHHDFEDDNENPILEAVHRGQLEQEGAKSCPKKNATFSHFSGLIISSWKLRRPVLSTMLQIFIFSLLMNFSQAENVEQSKTNGIQKTFTFNGSREFHITGMELNKDEWLLKELCFATFDISVSLLLKAEQCKSDFSLLYFLPTIVFVLCYFVVTSVNKGHFSELIKIASKTTLIVSVLTHIWTSQGNLNAEEDDGDVSSEECQVGEEYTSHKYQFWIIVIGIVLFCCMLCLVLLTSLLAQKLVIRDPVTEQKTGDFGQILDGVNLKIHQKSGFEYENFATENTHPPTCYICEGDDRKWSQCDVVCVREKHKAKAFHFETNTDIELLCENDNVNKVVEEIANLTDEDAVIEINVSTKAYTPSVTEEIIFERQAEKSIGVVEKDYYDIGRDFEDRNVPNMGRNATGVSNPSRKDTEILSATNELVEKHFVAELGILKNGQPDISVLIPEETPFYDFGRSQPLDDGAFKCSMPTVGKKKVSKEKIEMKVIPKDQTDPNTNESNEFKYTFIKKMLGMHELSYTIPKKKLRMQVVSNQLGQLRLDTISQKTSLSRRMNLNNDTFFNLKHKVKAEKSTKKIVDCTLEEEELDRLMLLRDTTWLPVNDLPVPEIDLTVAHITNFEPLMEIIDLIAAGTPPTPHVSMRYELLRFCTLRSYPKEDKPFLIKLSEAGFYYASDGDGVVCYCCGIRRYNWTAEDDPHKIHERINPSCKYLRKNEEVNVPVQYFGPYSKELMAIMEIPEPIERPHVSEDVNNDWAPERVRAPASQQQNRSNGSGTNALGINTAIPKHSQYATKTSRVESFKSWPDSASHTPDTLADAGFFYAGFGDCVRCFYCGIGLRHWTAEDDPWIEHARWSKTCVFVKQKKGEEFVNLVQLAVQYSQDNESNPSGQSQLQSQEIERLLLSDAAQSVLEMGYQPRIIKKSIEEILKQNAYAKITAELLMEKVLEIEELENRLQAGPQAPVSTTARPMTAATRPAATQIKAGTAHAEVLKHVENITPSAKCMAENEPEKSEKAKENKSKAEIQEDPKAIKKENEELKEQTLCKVCLDNTVCIVFLPCGHLVTCADCAPAMRKCPICRALVKGTVRTYMS